MQRGAGVVALIAAVGLIVSTACGAAAADGTGTVSATAEADTPAASDAHTAVTETEQYELRYLEGAYPEKWKTIEAPFIGGMKFWMIPFAYLRIEYLNVADDSRYDFVGVNDGFFLDNARFGAAAGLGQYISAAFSVEAASDQESGTNTPSGEIDVRLRDGFLRFDPIDYAGVQGGQFKVPFTAEGLRATPELLFIDRAVGETGVLVGRGFEQHGLGFDRDVGVLFSPRRILRLRDFGVENPTRDIGFNYYLMIANGNGENQLLNDNSSVAIFGRLEALYSNVVTLGGAFLTNDRTVGNLPNQFDENDTGFDIDLMINPYGLELYGQYVRINTDFDTVAVSDRSQEAWHVQIGYRFTTPYVYITPGYRFASFDPFARGGGTTFDSFELQYQTLGLRLDHPTLPLTFFVNYTFTDEQSPRELNNDVWQMLAQIVF